MSVAADRVAYHTQVGAQACAWRLTCFGAVVVDDPVSTILTDASESAPVAADQVPVVALFGCSQEPVTAQRRTSNAVDRAHCRPGWLTAFSAAVIHNSIAAHFRHTTRGASVAVGQISVVALLGRSEEPVTAQRRPDPAGVGARSGSRRLAGFCSVVVDHPIAAELEHTARRASVAV
jgi:hypothetical protein